MRLLISGSPFPEWLYWVLTHWWLVAMGFVALLFGLIAFVIWLDTRKPRRGPDVDME